MCTHALTFLFYACAAGSSLSYALSVVSNVRALVPTETDGGEGRTDSGDFPGQVPLLGIKKPGVIPGPGRSQLVSQRVAQTIVFHTLGCRLEAQRPLHAWGGEETGRSAQSRAHTCSLGRSSPEQHLLSPLPCLGALPLPCCTPAPGNT